MSSRLREERGLTLPEMLTAMALFMLVLGSSLDVLDGFVARNSVNTKQNEGQDAARTAIDRLARQLRNLASPTNANVKSIDRATEDDLVFQTVDPVKRRVRYCLESSPRRLWMQTQAFPLGSVDPGMPPSTECPGPTGTGAWASARVIVRDVVNRAPTPNQRVFDYSGDGIGAVGAPIADTSKITGIRANLWIDVNPGKPPSAVSIASGDFLRNQNQKPTASFTLQGSPHGSRRFIMNASQSTDPESRTLDYYWYKGTGNTADLPSCQDDATQSGGGFTCLGRGLTLSYTFPATDQGTPTITLKVVDPGSLSAVSQQQTPYLLP